MKDKNKYPKPLTMAEAIRGKRYDDVDKSHIWFNSGIEEAATLVETREAERGEKIKTMLVKTGGTSYEDGWNDAILKVLNLLGISMELPPILPEKFLPWQIGYRKH